jgi:hypothetical protein
MIDEWFEIIKGNGGTMDNVFDYVIKKSGLASAKSYPYNAKVTDRINLLIKYESLGNQNYFLFIICNRNLN